LTEFQSKTILKSKQNSWNI